MFPQWLCLIALLKTQISSLFQVHADKNLLFCVSKSVLYAKLLRDLKTLCALKQLETLSLLKYLHLSTKTYVFISN